MQLPIFVKLPDNKMVFYVLFIDCVIHDYYLLMQGNVTSAGSTCQGLKTVRKTIPKVQ